MKNLAFSTLGIAVFLLLPQTTLGFAFEHKTTHVLESPQSATTDNYATGDMVVDGDYLYVASGDLNATNYDVIDISEPSDPETIAVLTNADLGGGLEHQGFTVKDGYMYVPSFRELIVYDVRDLESPVETARITEADLTRGDAAVADGFLYIKSSSAGKLFIYNISNPGVPVRESIMDDSNVVLLLGQGEIISKRGDYLYLSQGAVSLSDGSEVESGGVQVIDVSDAQNPVAVRSYVAEAFQLFSWDQSAFGAEVMYAVNRNINFVQMEFLDDGQVVFGEGRDAGGTLKYLVEEDGYLINGVGNASGNQTIPAFQNYKVNAFFDIKDPVEYFPTAEPSLVSMRQMIHTNNHLIALVDGSVNDFGTSQIEVFSTNDHVYRFWSTNYNAHFYTSSLEERDSIIQNDPNWSYEGVSYETSLEESGGVPTYRFWSPLYQNHFYTISQAERDSIIANDPNWVYEGESFHVNSTQSGDLKPVYRFYSDSFKGHFFTPSQDEKEFVQANDPNWVYEGIAWYVQ